MLVGLHKKVPHVILHRVNVRCSSKTSHNINILGKTTFARKILTITLQILVTMVTKLLAGFPIPSQI